VLGEPFWDSDFNVMDVFILLELDRIQARYEKRYIAGRSELNIGMASSLA
jgi:putative hemolysin